MPSPYPHITFHRLVVAAAGNETLAALVDGLSGRTARARVWRGIVLGNVAQVTIDEHQAILSALESREQLMAHGYPDEPLTGWVKPRSVRNNGLDLDF
jgi:DNA-binding FadR family transcriptional regulator